MPTFHAHVTDPLSAATNLDQAITAAPGPLTRTVRRSLLSSRVNWGSAADTTVQGPNLAPAVDFQSPAGPATLAHSFTIDENGWHLASVRIYKAPLLAGTIPIGVWNSSGTLLATQSVAWSSDEGGWREIVLLSPITLTSGQEYTVGYHVPGNDYAYSPWVWNAQDTSVYPFFVRSFVESAGSRLYGSGMATGASLTFPNLRGPANFYIDPVIEKADDLPGYTGLSDYYTQFPNGGTSFSFPIGVYFADPEFLAGYVDLGINTLINGSMSDTYIDAVKATGMEWYPSCHGGDMTPPVVVQSDPALQPLVRGYLLTDEPDLVTPYNSPAVLRGWHSSIRHIDSTRPITLNLSKNVVRNQGFFWQPVGVTPRQANLDWRSYATMGDVLYCDDYTLAADDSYNPSGAQIGGSGPVIYGIWAYALHIKRLLELNDGRTPIWGVVESTSEVPGRPTPTEVERAAWAQLIAGARGVLFFDHRFAGAAVSQDFAAMLSDSAMSAKITSLTSRLQELGDALMAEEANLVEGYSSTGAMTAAKGGYANGASVPVHYTSRMVSNFLLEYTTYIFAQAIRPGSTTATFSSPALAGATLTVIGESRTIDVDGSGGFTDTFSSDYAFHLYSTTDQPTLSVPANIVAPAITTDGTPETGETVISSQGTWTGTPTPSYTYQWQRNGSAISGAVSPGYTLQVADEGQSIRCHVTAANSQGTLSANSNTIFPAAPADVGTPYQDTVIADGPVGYWRLADLTDSSGNSLTLTAAGATTNQSSLLTTEPTNGAKGFNSSTDALSRATETLLDINDAITLEAWVKPTALNAEFAVATKGATRLQLRPTNKFRVYLTLSGIGDIWVDGTTVVTSGDTYHVVGTYDGVWLRLYVNGVEEANLNWPTSGTGVIASNTEPFVVGNGAVGGVLGWVGTIDEVALYDVALTSTQVTDHYAAGTTSGGGGSSLTLDSVDVDGLPGYLAGFSTPISTDETFFPIGAWFQNFVDQSEVDQDISVGINLYIVLDTGADTTLVTDNSLKVLVQADQWAAVDAPWRSGWHVIDEPDMSPGSTDEFAAGQRSTVASAVAGLPADGKLHYFNLSKGAAWGQTDSNAGLMVNIAGIHALSDDVYWFTDPWSYEIEAPPWLPEGSGLISGGKVRRPSNYGYLVERMRQLDGLDGSTPAERRPMWTFVEIGWPFFDDEATAAGVTNVGITANQMRAAVWHSIIGGALGILYFCHSFGGTHTAYATQRDTTNYAPIISMMTSVNAQIQSLKDVLFSPTVIDAAFTFSSNMRAMAKVFAGDLYVFAGSATDGGTGSHTGTFTVTGLGDATATVVGESRTVSVTGDDWSDTFADSNSVHIYQIPMP